MKYFLLIGASFLGGVFGSYIFTASPLQAALQKANYSAVQLYDAKGKRVGYLGSNNGQQGALFLFDSNGRVLAQLGSYGAGSESGQSLFGLHDRSGNLRMLQRLHGGQDSPVIVMKDKNGRDRIVMGLEGAGEVPYLRVTDSYGKTRDVLR